MLTDNDIATTGASASEIEFTMAAFDTAEAFGNVNVRKKGDTYQIQFTLLLEPQKHLSKAWKTGVAMDASASMKNVYGRRMQGFMTEDVVKVYKKKGWFTRETRDGRRIYTFQRAAVDDALARGIVSLSSNTMDFVAPELLTYLANHLDMDSETPLIYFSGGNGSELEVIATLSENEAANLNIDGPNHMMFGDKSRLLPAVEYFTETYQSAPMGMFVFITDGNIDDIAELRHYCARLANDIAADKRNIV